jgi:hypothetical protein
MHACHPFPVVERLQCYRAAFSLIHLPVSVPLRDSLEVYGRIVLMFVALLIPCASSAKTLTVENYLKDKNAFTNFHISWLDGVFNGLKGANSELQSTNKALLFCPPPNFSMTAQQVNSFFDKFITTHKDKVSASDPIGTLLLEALQEAYPCPR